MFKVGNIVVLPGYGVGKITNLTTRHLGLGDLQDIFEVEIEDEVPKKVLIPVESADAKMRKLTVVKDVYKVFEEIKKGCPDIRHLGWSLRYREMINIIHSGDLLATARAYGELCLLSKEKDLSFGERKMKDWAKNLIVKELSHIVGKSARNLEEELEQVAG